MGTLCMTDDNIESGSPAPHSA